MNIATLSKFTSEVASYSNNLESIGLLNGKMGLCINVYEIAKITDNAPLKIIADNLLDEIIATIHVDSPTNFIDGLAGIGWGISYLILNNHVSANVDEVLAEFDEQILRQRFTEKTPNFDFFSGLLGHGFYLSERVTNNNFSEKSLPLLVIKQSIVGIIDSLYELTNPNRNLVKEPEGFTRYWDLSICLNFFHQVYLLDLYNSKVKKITNILFKMLFLEIPKSHSFRLQLSLIIKKMGLLTSNPDAASIYIFLKNIDRNVLLSEIGESNEDNLRHEIEILKLYSELIQIDESTILSDELHFWKNKVKQHLSYIYNNEAISEKTLRDAQLMGMFDGFNGFYRLLPTFNEDICQGV